MELVRSGVLPFVLTALGGCLQPSSIECNNDGVCPPEFRCAIVHDAFGFGDNGEKWVCVPPSCAPWASNADCNDQASHGGCSSHCSLEQPGWTTTGAAPHLRVGHAMAYDAARGRVVLFGGDLVTALPSSPCSVSSDDSRTATWEWDGTLWRQRTPRATPPARSGHAMAYDASRERVVMFGGDRTGANSTWEWDGASWIEQTPATSPPASLSDFAMVYDAGRRRVVLFGGDNVQDSGGDHNFQDRTWAWDGANWTPIDTMAGPSPRAAPAMAYDSKRGRVVMFGGVADSGRNDVSPLDDTWELEGDAWAKASASGGPGPRGYAGMAFDAARGKVVMFGGATGTHPSSRYTDTWEWDGSQWTPWTTGATTVAPQVVAPMTYDIVRGKVVLFGAPLALDGGEVIDGTWEWDGTVWTRRAVGCSSSASMDGASTLPDRPPPRAHQAMTYDATRAATVMFGGRQGEMYLSDTWEWNGSEWRAEAPTVSQAPSGRAGHAMAFDARRNVTVMFGGTGPDPSNPGATTRFDDTWEWDGASWSGPLSPAIKPTARSGHAMVYDAARNTILMIGGNDDELDLGEQCEWDGTTWTCLTPEVSPPWRTDFAVAYDAARARVVLFGGNGIFGPERDIWEWDGRTWTNQTPKGGPVARFGHTLGYDAMRDRVVLFGGQTGSAGLNDVWEWDGTHSRWTELSPTEAPSPRHHHAMVYDVARQNMMVFGGDGTTAELGDAWFFRYEDPAVPDEACDTGLDYDGDGLAGCADPDCAGLCARCGDGVCDASEGCGLCPGDCGACDSVCGDFQCGPGETCFSCPGDCGLCSSCGDTRCEGRETCSSCPKDCGPCNDPLPSRSAPELVTGG